MSPQRFCRLLARVDAGHGQAFVLLRSLKQSTVLSTNFAVHPLIMMQ